jgi:hypothetical protein
MRSSALRLITIAALATVAAAATGLAARSALADSVATVTKTAGAVVNVKALGSTDSMTVLGSSGWKDVPGSATTIAVPAGHKMLVDARFTAESACFGASSGCPVQVLIGGVPAGPTNGSNGAFDSTEGGTESSASWESHSTDLSRILGPGTYPVKVQVLAWGGATFQIRSWTLTLTKAVVS